MWANGDIYSGAWYQGVRRGNGTYISILGFQISGEWYCDLPFTGVIHKEEGPRIHFNQYETQRHPIVFIPCYTYWEDIIQGEYWTERVASINSFAFTEPWFGTLHIQSKAPFVLSRRENSWPPQILYGTISKNRELMAGLFHQERRPNWSTKNGAWGKIDRHKLFESLSKQPGDQQRLKFAISQLEYGIWKNADKYCVWPFPDDCYKYPGKTKPERRRLRIDDPETGPINISYIIEDWGNKRLRITQIEYEDRKSKALMLGEEDEIEITDNDMLSDNQRSAENKLQIKKSFNNYIPETGNPNDQESAQKPYPYKTKKQATIEMLGILRRPADAEETDLIAVNKSKPKNRSQKNFDPDRW
jgi:hypothetical protein